LQEDLPQIVKESFETKVEGFTKIVQEANVLLRGENGKIENFTVYGRLVELEPHGEALVVGDIHGDLESLIDILKGSNILQRMAQNRNVSLIFLGDYGDRGAYSAETYYTILKLKLLFPEQIVLLRGNHEGPKNILAYPHDLPVQFKKRFGRKWTDAYAKIRELFACLYNAVLVKERYLMVHGGLPSELGGVDDLANTHTAHPNQSFLEDLLWSDPNDIIKDLYPSPRGAGNLFGKEITDKVLKKLNVKIVIRGHEPCQDGFKIDHDGKILTLFSRKGPPYFNDYGAYLDMDLSRQFESAEQLIPCIHKF
jgi:protein phosphatase